MCGDLGHFSKSTLCKGKAKGLRKVQEEDSSEEDVTRLKEETVAGVTKEGEPDSRIRVSIEVTKQGDSFRGVTIEVLADTGVRRTILNLGDWEKLGGGELKKTKLRFRLVGTAAVKYKIAWLKSYYPPRDDWFPKYQFAAPNLDFQITSQIIFLAVS